MKKAKVILCIIARTESSRLPQKVLMNVQGKMLIEHIIEKCKNVNYENKEIILCTTNGEDDDKLVDVAKKHNLKFVRGSVESVYSRIKEAAEKYGGDVVVRITGDNIFTDLAYLNLLIEKHIDEKVEYSRVEHLPAGVTSEVINFSSLERCYEMYDENQSEYMTVHLFNPEQFNILVIMPPEKHFGPLYNLSVDTPEDFTRTLSIFEIYEQPTLDEIFHLFESDKISDYKIDSSKQVKLGKDRILPYTEYREWLDGQIAKCKVIQL